MRKLNDIDLDACAAQCKGPGKFEGETLATVYFWECMLNGDGEIVGNCNECDDDCDCQPLDSADLFTVDAEEADALGLPIGSYVVLHEDSNGFVTLLGPWECTREQADAKFSEWAA